MGTCPRRIYTPIVNLRAGPAKRLADECAKCVAGLPLRHSSTRIFLAQAVGRSTMRGELATRVAKQGYTGDPR